MSPPRHTFVWFRTKCHSGLVVVIQVSLFAQLDTRQVHKTHFFSCRTRLVRRAIRRKNGLHRYALPKGLIISLVNALPAVGRRKTNADQDAPFLVTTLRRRSRIAITKQILFRLNVRTQGHGTILIQDLLAVMRTTSASARFAFQYDSWSASFGHLI